MIEITVGQMFACLPPIMALSKQELNMEQAEKIADFVGAFIDIMVPLEDERTKLVEADYDSMEEQRAVVEVFANEKRELPEINFKEFPALRISPDALVTLKRAGLYTSA